MAINTLQSLEVIEVMENFLSRIRPSEDIRSKLDIDYKIEEQSIIVFEIRPQWNKPKVMLEHPFAKASFVKSKNIWKVFWKRADQKWHSYTPKPIVENLKEFTTLVEEDEHHCFFG